MKDVIWATNSAELYVMLTDQRGWAPLRYERWLTNIWNRLLLPDPEPSRRDETEPGGIDGAILARRRRCRSANACRRATRN